MAEHHHTERCQQTFGAVRVISGVVVPTLAFAAAALAILRGAGSPATSRAFASTPQFWVWCLLACIEAAAWALAAGLVWIVLARRWRSEDRSTKLKLVGLLVVFAGLVVIPGAIFVPQKGVMSVGFAGVPLDQLSLDDIPLSGYMAKAAWLARIGLGVAFITCVGVVATAITLNRLEPADPPTTEDLGCFSTLRGDLSTLLGVMGLLLGVSTLATGALRSAMLAVDHDTAYLAHGGVVLEFASQYVLAYGLLCAALLAIAFLPSFLAMRAAGSRLLERALPLPAPGDPELAAVVERRAGLEKLLQTSLSANPTIKAGAAILAPLAASVVSLLLPTK